MYWDMWSVYVDILALERFVDINSICPVFSSPTHTFPCPWDSFLLSSWECWIGSFISCNIFNIISYFLLSSSIFCCINWPNIVILSFTSSMLAEFFSTIFPITSFTSHLYTNISIHGERIRGLKLIRKKKLLLQIKAPRSMYQYLFVIINGTCRPLCFICTGFLAFHFVILGCNYLSEIVNNELKF